MRDRDLMDRRREAAGAFHACGWITEGGAYAAKKAGRIDFDRITLSITGTTISDPKDKQR